MRIPYLLLLVAGLVIAVAVLAFAFLPNASQPSSTPTTEAPETTDTDQTPSGGLSIRQPDEKTMYNTGSGVIESPGKDGVSIVTYTNAQLGISFSFPAELGMIDVVNNTDQILFSFTDPQTSTENTFMVLYKQEPSGRDSYWGDIGSGVMSDDFDTLCATLTNNSWDQTPTCEIGTTKGGYAVMHISGSYSEYGSPYKAVNFYIIPQKTDIYSDVTISDIDLPANDNVSTAITSIVDSLTFSPLQPIYY